MLRPDASYATVSVTIQTDIKNIENNEMQKLNNCTLSYELDSLTQAQ